MVDNSDDDGDGDVCSFDRNYDMTTVIKGKVNFSYSTVSIPKEYSKRCNSATTNYTIYVTLMVVTLRHTL